MSVEKIDHIHVYVKDLAGALRFFSELLGTKFSRVIHNEEFGFEAAMEPLGISLIAPISPTSHVARFIAKRGEGMSAICLKVSDLEETARKLVALGLQVVGRTQDGGVRQVHFHPKDSYGVQIELSEYDDVHGAIIAAESPGQY
ncbi:MAG: VOC family protein [Chloroflexi bacterium]|nr:VOC family protein [Chloroflexota bacterium]